MPKKSGKHPILNLLYHHTDTGIIFQDGVEYTNNELKVLKQAPPMDYKYLHMVKDIMKAEVIK